MSWFSFIWDQAVAWHITAPAGHLQHLLYWCAWQHCFGTHSGCTVCVFRRCKEVKVAIGCSSPKGVPALSLLPGCRGCLQMRPACTEPPVRLLHSAGYSAAQDCSHRDKQCMCSLKDPISTRCHRFGRAEPRDKFSLTPISPFQEERMRRERKRKRESNWVRPQLSFGNFNYFNNHKNYITYKQTTTRY